MTRQARKQTSPPNEVTFRYTDSPFSRVIHVDGLWGGLVPDSTVHMAVFSQHHPIPDSVTHQLEPTGKLGKEKGRKQHDGLVRTVEAE